MAPRPIFAATHPRACSTAFERVFMTRRDTMQSMHEPFGDPFYFGPELMSERFREDAERCDKSGYGGQTYKDVLDEFAQAEQEGKRLFIKDMAQYLFAPDGKHTPIAESLGGGDEAGNPTVLPLSVLKQFTFTFLIRHPRRSVPSYWRCCVPPQNEITGFTHFMPNEAGYLELRRLFDYLLEQGIIDRNQVVVVDADDMLDNPEPTIKDYCQRTGIDFTPEMLIWNDEDKEHCVERFEKWAGWHDDAIESDKLRARTHAQKSSTVESENKDWLNKYGAEAQKIIRATVDENIPHYEYLKQFCRPVQQQ